jgi:Fic family protein
VANHDARVLDVIRSRQPCATADIVATTGLSPATVKRVVGRLVADGSVRVSGRGRATRYGLSPTYEVLAPFDVDAYYAHEVDQRSIHESFNWELLETVLPTMSLLSAAETARLSELDATFRANIARLGPAARRRELERLAIDLSWKSSQIEGNTYSLLETERLLKDKQTATGKTRDEATMLLNHKTAIDFVMENPDYLVPLSVSRIEDIHSLLIADLDLERNVRNVRVGVTGTNYRPLDNAFQIREALEMACQVINAKGSVFERALLAMLLISYIQPFVDGNKRTARIVGNAVLIGDSTCPLSFRTVDAVDYQKAMLIFYEQGNMSPFKDIFIAQFAFAVGTYF